MSTPCSAPPPVPDTVNVTTADCPDGARGGGAVYIVSPCNCEVLETEAQADARHKARHTHPQFPSSHVQPGYDPSLSMCRPPPASPRRARCCCRRASSGLRAHSSSRRGVTLAVRAGRGRDTVVCDAPLRKVHEGKKEKRDVRDGQGRRRRVHRLARRAPRSVPCRHLRLWARARVLRNVAHLWRCCGEQIARRPARDGARG